MPQKRDSQSDSAFIISNAIRYFDRFGREYTWISISTTRDEDGKVTNVTKTSTTIKGDLQFENMPKFYNQYGISPEGDGMFFTLSSYGVSVNDEITDPDNSKVKWKLVKQIENEFVGTGKPYVGFVTQKAP